MSNYIDDFKRRVLTEGVLDPEDVHHEFVTRTHGRKLDFDKIRTGSGLYRAWMDAMVRFIQEEYDQQPDMIVGVANGANRMAVSIAAGLGDGTIGLMTEKASAKSSKLHVSVEDVISGYKPAFVLVVEDVGTSGTSSVSAAQNVLAAGAQRVEVLNTWQRQPSLFKLEEADIAYRSMITEEIPTYQPDDCEHCKNGVRLITHAKASG